VAQHSLAEVVGKRVKALRERHGWDQSELSQRLATVGLEYAQPTISRIERGERELSTTELFSFAGVLHVSPLELVTPAEDDAVEAAGGVLDPAKLRGWVRGFAAPPELDALAFYDAMPANERRAFRIAGVERLVRWTTDRLLRALGDGDTEFALRLLDDIERFTGTIRDEITEGGRD
jgi:transcriptional regulator with XRE-family HTH domain